MEKAGKCAENDILQEIAVVLMEHFENIDEENN